MRSFLLVSGCLFAAFAGLNRAVDPYGAYGGCPSELFLPFRSEAGSRIAKAELAEHFQGATVILGSSRAEVGYNPESVAIPEGGACNLGLSGTNFLELAHVIDHVLQQPRLRRIVLCFDFQQFDETESVNFDFETSRFNRQLSSFDYHCNLLLCSESTEASLETLASYFQDESASVDVLGHRRPEAMQSSRGPAELSQKLLRNVLSEREDLAAIRRSQPRFQLLERAVQKCLASDVELIVVIQPLHATMYEAYQCAGIWDEHERWLSDVVHVVEGASGGRTPVWDFTSYSPYTAEPLLATAGDRPANRWFWEASHCTAELGEKILQRVFGHPSANPDFGRRLTTANLEAHLAALDREHEAWLANHRDEAAAVRQLALEAGCRVEATVAVMPSEATAR